MLDHNNKPNVKLLIGSLHWMRKIRNSCAHNERIYCIRRNGRIVEKYFKALRPSYTRGSQQSIIDLIVYFKYYLPSDEFRAFISEFQTMLLSLKAGIEPRAFEYIRSAMGIKDLEDLDNLTNMSKNEIEYNKFDTF